MTVTQQELRKRIERLDQKIAALRAERDDAQSTLDASTHDYSIENWGIRLHYPGGDVLAFAFATKEHAQHRIDRFHDSRSSRQEVDPRWVGAYPELWTEENAHLRARAAAVGARR